MFYNVFGELVNNQPTENFSNIYETDSIEQFSNEAKEPVQVEEETVQVEEKSVKQLPKLKDQDFLAMDGNLVLDGVVKATNFIKTDGSEVKEVPILKNNYILPNDIKYTAGGKLEIKELKSNSVDSETMKTKKAEIAGPLHLYDKTTKGDDSDAYKIEKVRTAPNKNQLRVVLHDDPDESMAIWGNSCANGKCGDDNKAKEAHKFDVRGNVEHKGHLSVASNNVNHIKNPNGLTRITRHGIMFGGANDGKEINSAQITAGVHEGNSLNIVGMSSDKNWRNRAVTMWAEKGFKINGYIKNNMPDTRHVNENPQQYRSKMQKGVITEFKQTATVGLNRSLYGDFGVLTTTVPWINTTGGLVHQKFESVFRGRKCVCERYEVNNTTWGPWDGALEIKTAGLAPGISNFGGIYEPFSYSKVNGLVTVSGLIRPNGRTHYATLPNGYRPRKRLIFSVKNPNLTTRVDVEPNGRISYEGGGRNHNWLSLSGISFPAFN